MAAPLRRVRTRLADLRVFTSARARRRVAIHALVAAVGVTVATMLARPHLALLTDATALRTYVAGFGVWAPLVLIGLQTTQVVLAPIPGQVLAVVAGYLFGVWWGTLYNMVGIALGSTLAFWLARRFGRGYVERVVHPDVLGTFDAASAEYARPALFLAFLVPGLPDDIICFAGGLTPVPLWQLVVLAVVGRAPAFFLANAVGGFLGTGRYAEAALLATAVMAVSGLCYLHRGRLLRLFRGLG